VFDHFGWGELAVIVVLGLFVFGPERLPRVISDAVRTVKQLRAQAASMTSDLKAELDPHLDEFRSLDPRDGFDLGSDGPPAQRSGRGSSEVRPAAAARPPRLVAGDLPPYDPDAT
jgi:sec-independent protein translocase protein TatB